MNEWLPGWLVSDECFGFGLRWRGDCKDWGNGEEPWCLIMFTHCGYNNLQKVLDIVIQYFLVDTLSF
jgi:hypothetical protein